MLFLKQDNSDTALRAEKLPPKLFIFSHRDPDHSYFILEDERRIGQAALYDDGFSHTLLYCRFYEDESEELMRHAVAVAANRAIVLFHPSIIYSYSHDLRMKKIFPVNQFYPKGEMVLRTVEPWRYQIADSCFDREGYLIDQGSMHGLPFGWFDTREKGCGWIAAYNFLKLNGKEKTMQEVAEELEKNHLLGEMFGENFFLLAHYLRQQELPIHTAFGKGPVLRAMKASRNGILLYSRKLFGGHYIAYRVRSDGSLYVYNAVYGKVSHHMFPDEFFAHYAKGPKAMLAYVGQNEKVL
ncbi:MAG: hypothetical protein IJ225_12135 [Solobacterium sp.]|nr:hypothetical protein [Solobacterium sp.]